MKNLRTLALAALMVLPIAACDDDEGDGGGTTPDIVGSVTGSVSVEGTAIQGVTVTLAGATQQTTTTAADGSYSFQNVPGGTYTISLSNLPSDATFTNPTQTITISSTGQVASADFSGNFIRTAAITGVVLVDDEPAPGIAVSLSGTESGSTATDGLGTFAFTGLRAGDYAVAITSPNPDIQFGETTQNVTIAVGESASLVFAGLVPDEPVVSLFGVGTTAGNTACGAVVAGPGCTVAGSFSYIVNFDGGDETADRVSAYLSGPSTGGEFEEVAWQQFSTSGGAAAASDQVALFFNSASFDPNTFAVDFLNGNYTVMVCMLTVEGTEVCATSSLVLTFANVDVLAVRLVDGGNSLISNGAMIYGGSGSQIVLDAIAIIYSMAVENIASISVANASSAGFSQLGARSLWGTQAVSIDGGTPGAPSTTTRPFLYTIDAADNDGPTGVENAPAAGAQGSNFVITALFDEDGLNLLPMVTASGVVNTALQIPIDFVAPRTNTNAAGAFAASDFTVNASDFNEHPGSADGGIESAAPVFIQGNGLEWFSGGAFNVTNVQEGGVGGINWQLDVDDSDATEPDFTDVKSVSDLVERDVTAFRVEAVQLSDDLMNFNALSSYAPAGPTQVIQTLNRSNGRFGADFGAVAIESASPFPGEDMELPAEASQVVDDDGNKYFVLNYGAAADNTIDWQVDDPTLADGTAGPGVALSDVHFNIEDVDGNDNDIGATGAAAQDADLTDDPNFTLTAATAFDTETGNVNASLAITAGVAQPTFTGIADDPAAAGAVADNTAYMISATNTDNAIAENNSPATWYMIMDNLEPAVELVSPPSGGGPFTVTVVEEVIQARANDGMVELFDGNMVAMPLSSIQFSFRDPAQQGDGTDTPGVSTGADGAPGTCEVDDAVIGDYDPTTMTNVWPFDNIEEPIIDIPVDEADNGATFSATVRFYNPGTVVQNICIFVEVADGANDNTASLAPNTNDQSQLVSYDWQ